MKKKNTFPIPLHSLHGYHKSLNIKTPKCNVLVFFMSLMSLSISESDMSDMAFCLSLHLESLNINDLQHSCNECNEFSTVEKILV